MDQVLDRTVPDLGAETVQRLREDLIVEQTEKVPFWTRFRFEVPKHPAVGPLFENSNLSGDVEFGVLPELLTPLINVVDGFA